MPSLVHVSNYLTPHFPGGFNTAVEPSDCEQGHYCPLQTPSPDRYPCPAGTYTTESNLASADECTPCPAGQYCLGKPVTSHVASHNEETWFTCRTCMCLFFNAFDNALQLEVSHRLPSVQAATTAPTVRNSPHSTRAPMARSSTVLVPRVSTTARSAHKVSLATFINLVSHQNDGLNSAVIHVQKAHRLKA